MVLEEIALDLPSRKVTAGKLSGTSPAPFLVVALVMRKPKPLKGTTFSRFLQAKIERSQVDVKSHAFGAVDFVVSFVNGYLRAL